MYYELLVMFGKVKKKINTNLNYIKKITADCSAVIQTINLFLIRESCLFHIVAGNFTNLKTKSYKKKFLLLIMT